jgi:hypothetical protein
MASDSFLAHVTLAITVYTWVELFAEWLQLSKADIRFRKALPPVFASRKDLKESLKDEFTQVIIELKEGTDYDRLLESFLHRVRAGHSRTGGEFHSDVVV